MFEHQGTGHSPQRPTSESKVFVGLPVRNGAAFLATALEALLRQTHRNLEIVISDNASTDNTAAICEGFARGDDRIRLIKRPTAVPADVNFRSTFEECGADWFMWASHDDLRDDNYVETLLRGFESEPEASMVFTDIVVFSDHRRPHGKPIGGSSVFSSLCKPPQVLYTEVVNNGAVPIYGLFRSDVLRSFRWPPLPTGHDWMILHWAATLGNIRHVPGSTFRYFISETRSDEETRSYHWLRQGNWLDRIRLVPDIRWAFYAFRELSLARRLRGLPALPLAFLPALCFLHHGGHRAWARQFAYANSPVTARRAWKALKTRMRRHAANTRH